MSNLATPEDVQMQMILICIKKVGAKTKFFNFVHELKEKESNYEPPVCLINKT
jgi:hypothetical protein